MKPPDFFIVGAPRCGTTALSRYLAGHPQVCFADPKETHYFSGLVVENPVERAEAQYLERFFPHYRPGRHTAVGEGSVTYLYSDEAIRRILRFNPEAKFIALVRSPLEMLPSYHLRLRFLMEEDEPDFARAWDLQEARARGQHLPAGVRSPRFLQYARVGRVGACIERLFEMAGREQCCVTVFDDFASDPQAAYQRVLRFLGLPDDGRTDFEPQRVSRMWKRAWLHRLLARWIRPALFWMPIPLARLFDALPTGSRRRLPAVKRWTKRLEDANTRVRRPASLRPATRRALRRAFETDVEKLSSLLGRDLTGWLRPRAAAAPLQTNC